MSLFFWNFCDVRTALIVFSEVWARISAYFMRNILSHTTVIMKAISPVRSMRNNITNSSEHALGIARSKSPMDDPLNLLYNMNDCYTKLKELVPSLPQNKNVSKIEILQHVIDYILDLQIALDSSSIISSCQHQQQRPGQPASPRNPLATINSDISLLTFQSNDQLPKETDDS
ncbi:unnamed protein product [Oncorhynchus mykiss]|uniref:DNA-binding protein inhibitor ID-4 n=1 Tax=Oncorhynchus mykiss TaxID=8022 RepID=A0A060W3Q5_ONCMY|nr:unnamed protein product [Oncorhynchus mykiss]